MDLTVSIVRTAVPYIIGWLASYGITLTDNQMLTVSSILAFGISIAYYVVVRVIEKKYPKAGWFLGYPAKPTYKEVKNG